jgi:phosphate transport system substrate-binding protein
MAFAPRDYLPPRIAMDNIPKFVFLGFIVLVVGALTAIGLHRRNTMPSEAPLQGAGSTFINPLMVQWSVHYEKSEAGCRIGYQSVGSGLGIKWLLNRKFDFACSDAPLTADQMATLSAAGDKAIHVPLVLGAVVPVYNLAGLKQPLQFSGPVLADIYLGKITKWNDKALSDLNPGVQLPNEMIGVVHRSDGSGTTFIWADYLTKVSPAWKETVGAGTEVKWPTGVGESGNQGVAEKVQKTHGSIGYVELTYAFRLDLAYGLVRDSEGEFVRASIPSVMKAADNSLGTIPEDLRYSMTDAPGKGSYPIVGTTWAILNNRQPTAKGRQLADFLTWAVGDGQVHVETLLYARLPEALVERARKKINEIEFD